jgi:hypothetical protein
LIRQVYTLMVCPDVVVPRSIGLDTHERIDNLLGILIATQNNPSTPEDRDANLPRIATDVNAYEVWSWDRQRVWHSCRVGQIPKPGVIFVMPAGVSEQRVEFRKLLLNAKSQLTHEGGSEKYRRHIQSPWAHWIPRPLSAFDVLLSSAEADSEIADDLADRLATVGLSVERATRHEAAQPLVSRLRWQLSQCQVLISLLTPRSIQDPTIAAEAGACWVLAKPFVPVVWKLSPSALPPSMATRQCVAFDDDTTRNGLARQIRMLVSGT